MKKRHVISLILAIFLMLTIITNPSDKDEYGDWLTSQITKEEGAILGYLGGSFLKLGTTKKDYLLFTIYETKYDDKKDPMVALGFFNNFIWINEGE